MNKPNTPMTAKIDSLQFGMKQLGDALLLIGKHRNGTNDKQYLSIQHEWVGCRDAIAKATTDTTMSEATRRQTYNRVRKLLDNFSFSVVLKAAQLTTASKT